MYDLHNHLLPGIDDGAPDIDTAIDLAKMAVTDGISHMVCTPHIHPGRYDNNQGTIQQALNQFKSALAKNKIDLQVSAAAEVRIGPEILQGIQNQALPFIGQWQNQDVLLLEFPANAIPVGSDKLTKWLLAHEVIPMIAHPERNQVFQKHPDHLNKFLQQGCLTQLTAGALLGKFGQTAKRIAEKLLQEEKTTVIASDAHNLDYRPPILSQGFEQVAKLSSVAMAEQLFIHTPQQISANKFSEVKV